MADKGMRIVEAEMTCCEVAKGIDKLVKQALSHQLEAIEREVEKIDGFSVCAGGITRTKGGGLIGKSEIKAIIKKYKGEVK